MLSQPNLIPFEKMLIASNSSEYKKFIIFQFAMATEFWQAYLLRNFLILVSTFKFEGFLGKSHLFMTFYEIQRKFHDSIFIIYANLMTSSVKIQDGGQFKLNDVMTSSYNMIMTQKLLL